MAKPDRSARPVTMQDIARAAGVSQSTVSRVLNDAPTSVPIAADTRARVREVAARLGYRPNPLARGLRGARTMLLGVIVRDIMDPFFSMAVEALSQHALARGYNVVLGSAHSKADEAIAVKTVLETRHCDAIVLLGDMSDEPKLLEELGAPSIPVIAMWHATDHNELTAVEIDNRVGIEAAVDHLLELGHERIAFVGGRPLGDIRERRSAFIKRLEQNGITPPAEYVLNVTNDPVGGDGALRTLMNLDVKPTAIVCSTDHLATGILHAAHELGIHVPDDLSVVGFDDIPIAKYLVPALTTVHQPVMELAGVAVRLAMDDPFDGGPPERKHVLTPSLIVRKSTAKAPST